MYRIITVFISVVQEYKSDLGHLLLRFLDHTHTHTHTYPVGLL